MRVRPTVGGRNGAHGPALQAILTLDSLDGRTRPYRRFISIRDAIASDLGGEDRLSQIQLQLVHRLAALCLWCEARDAAALRGGAIDVNEYGRAASHARRIAESLGLERVPKDVTPDLHDYLASKRRPGAEAA